MNRRERRAAGKADKHGRAPGVGGASEALPVACFQEGNRLAQQGRLADAATFYRRAIAAKPDYAFALHNLGNALVMLGQRDEAIAAWRRALEADPDYALPHANLGNALSQQGRLDEAIAHLQRALALKPDFVDALDHLARTLLAAGKARQALDTTRRAIAIRPTGETRKIFVDSLRQIAFTSDDPALRAIVVTALSEPWARPDRLIAPAAALARQNPAVAACVDPVLRAWPARLSGDMLWSSARRSAICDDALLRALLVAAPICDAGLEYFFTNARSELLAQAQASEIADSGDATLLAFWCVLARQCFINEYVFALTGDESEAAERLWQDIVKALAADRDVAPLRLAAAGAYRPLHALPQAASLMARSWPPAVQSLLVQQVQEPLEEARDRAAIPALTPIDNAISQAVREQYEQNPYPRWIEMPPARSFETFDQYLRSVLPAANIPQSRRGTQCDILVAGCGTGHHAIDVAQRSKDARVLAIDLSLTSLAYARRKTRALGLTNVDYAQADILAAASIAREFDVIESGGVLHHLDDPMAGWRALLTLLRPGGLMYVGLYSETARRDVVAVRTFVAERGYGGTAADIRRFRQDVRAAQELPLGNILTSPDFFNTSGCRDLFFHVSEHRLTLPQIKAFLAENQLEFLGFHLDVQTLQRFRQRFTDGGALTDLDSWHAYESDNPQTFAAMYHFWIRKQE